MTPPLTAALYRRASEAVYCLTQAEGLLAEESCEVFAFFGSALLRQHLGIPCHAIAGAALYCFGQAQDERMLFGTVEAQVLTSDHRSFHCWIETDEWIIDLQAPLFARLRGVGRRLAALPCRMLQTLKPGPGPLPTDLTPGDFLVFPNARLTAYLTRKYSSSAILARFLAWVAAPRDAAGEAGDYASSSGPRAIHHPDEPYPTLDGQW